MNTISTYKKIFVCFGIFLMLCHSSVRSEYTVSIATAKTRPLGMGGAFTSVQDNLSALDFNPACLIINPAASGFEHTIFINALFPALILKNLSSDARLDYALGWLLRGAGFSVGRFQFGILFGEQSLQGISEHGSTSLFRDSGYRYRRNMEAGANLILSPNVSIGMAGDFLIRGNEYHKDVAVGYRYGLYLRTRNNIHIGLCFLDLPNDYSQDRIDMERLADETLNIGVSYRFFQRITLAFDIRNVSDDGKGAVREPHVGVEFYPFTHVHLRAGYFREKNAKREVFSWGMGILDSNQLMHKNDDIKSTSFLIDLAFLWSKDRIQGNSRYFMISGIFQI